MRIDFYISNSNHHWQMMSPVMQELRGVHRADVRLVSLCEFRRMSTPVAGLNELQLPFIILKGLRVKGTSTATGKKGLGGNKALGRNILREIIWRFWLKPSFVAANKVRPARVVLPNDVAFPFNKICRWLRNENIPFILMQEGIRFPLPNEEGGANYGTMGAEKIICWGESSKNYFEGIAKKSLLKPLGNPRFDSELLRDYSDPIREMRMKYTFGELNVMYISNPVDDQGFCSIDQKLELFSKFLQSISTRLQPQGIKVIVRLHPREDSVAFRNIVDELNLERDVIFIQDYPLFAVLSKVNAAVILASTVGLEATLLDVPIAVIELPGHGFIFDYVSSGLAYPIRFEDFLAEDFITFIRNGKAEKKEAMMLYRKNHLSNVGRSTELIAHEILSS